MTNQRLSRAFTLAATVVAVMLSAPSAGAADLNLSDTPLFLSQGAPPLNLLVVGRDHKLYYEAYNDASDLNGDGVLDVGYKGYLPNNAGGVDYYGYFDSYKCYNYDSSDSRFEPAADAPNKTCAGTWSGDFLNYLTTARIDALRKVLYGGKRSADGVGNTTLERTHIPMDAHSWGKEYTSFDVDHFQINQYTPYSAPNAGTRHLFANTTPLTGTLGSDEYWYNNNQAPLLRVIKNSPYRKWEWVSKESPVAGPTVQPAGSGPIAAGTIIDMVVRVQVCVPGLIGKENCRQYSNTATPPQVTWKPVGLLQEFGENDSMLFGLLTSSYTANKSGGVLRKNVGSLTNEINPNTGQFITPPNAAGIVTTLDRLRVGPYTRYRDPSTPPNPPPAQGIGGVNYDTDVINAGPQTQDQLCALPAMGIGTAPDGVCRMWGNPVAEMMYEGLRYFRGMQPTAAFTAIKNSTDVDIETQRLLLPRPNWTDPYSTYPGCAKPFETVMADIDNSYDSDQLPGSTFPLSSGSTQLSAGSKLPGLDVGQLATMITGHEPGVTGQHFIGESGLEKDGAPTPKTVTDLGKIRGLAPAEPTKEGGYYASSVSYFGLTNDIHPTVGNNGKGDQKVQTFAVALASPLPKIEIPVGGGRIVTLVPFAKSVKVIGATTANQIKTAQGEFQPTNQIVDFYVEDIAADGRSGTFQVNFEDVEAGNDHDMDAIVRYTYTVDAGNNVTVSLSSDYQAGGVIHHLGYVISGTTADGVYLEVQDCNKTGPNAYACNPGPETPAPPTGADNRDVNYFLDTPPLQPPGGVWDDNAGLPGSATRTFTPSSAPVATLLKDPLWYAAKWGGFKDGNDNDLPDVQSEWDKDPVGSRGYGVPDNYFLVTNALTLSQQLRDAFDEILQRTASASSASINSGAIGDSTRVYQARFNSADWTGELLAFGVNTTTGAVVTNPSVWDASEEIPDPADRQIITVNSDGTVNGNGAPTAFTTTDLDDVRKAQLTGVTPLVDQDVAAYVSYLRGDNSQEEDADGATYKFRKRASRLGDIVNSSPLYVGAPRARYSDTLEASGQKYSQFVSSRSGRQPIVYAGANDGMLHGFNATTGREVFGFIPGTVFRNLRKLTSPGYTHRYYVDGAANSGDVFFHGDSAWHTALVGGLNKGGQAVYALDVTDPTDLDSAETTPGKTFLWELTDADDADLGYTFGQPAIVRLHDGTWAAVFGNGYNNTNTVDDIHVSTTGNAVLYIVNIETGDIIRKLDTGKGMAADPTGANRANGLATPVMVDIDNDRIVDQAYAGDLFGNLWKFDLRGNTASSWGFAFKDSNNKPAPLFTARDGTDAGAKAQPITVRPEVARGPHGAGVMILFGTGKYLEGADKSVPPPPAPQLVQSFYGIIDKNTIDSSTNTFADTDRITRGDLVQQTILSEPLVDPDGPDGTSSSDPNDPDENDPGRYVRITSNNPLAAARGWYLDLKSPSGYQGERQVTDPAVRGDRVIFTTLLPDPDPCGHGGKSWLMELDLLDGSRLSEAVLDTNNDGKVDENDDLNGESASGVMDGQILSRPAILTCLDGSCPDRKLSSGSGGTLFEISEASDRASRGRQSWRQLR